jgi:hypothetical protein
VECNPNSISVRSVNSINRSRILKTSITIKRASVKYSKRFLTSISSPESADFYISRTFANFVGFGAPAEGISKGIQNLVAAYDR